MANSDNQIQGNSSLPMDTVQDKKDTSMIMQLLNQMEHLLKNTQMGSQLYDQTAGYIQQLKSLLNDNKPLTEKGKDLLKRANQFMQENPLLSAGLIAGAGFLLAMLLNNKK